MLWNILACERSRAGTMLMMVFEGAQGTWASAWSGTGSVVFRTVARAGERRPSNLARSVADYRRRRTSAAALESRQCVAALRKTGKSEQIDRNM